jgi:hypothetical protein
MARRTIRRSHEPFSSVSIGPALPGKRLHLRKRNPKASVSGLHHPEFTNETTALRSPAYRPT